MVTAFTLGDYGLASDVPNYFRSSIRQLEWAGGFLEALLSGRPGAWLEREAVSEHWRWWQVRVPHPPLSRELGGLSYVLLGDVTDPIVAYRGAVAASFATLVGAVGAFVHRVRRSVLGGLVAGAALLAMPPLFAYGHLALTDMFLTGFWFASVACLEVHLASDRDVWLVGAALSLGAAVATKFTGLLLIPVLAIWLLVRGGLRWRRVAVLGLGAAVVFVAVNPVMWVAPVQGLGDYFMAGLGRAESDAAQIVTHYLGQNYQYRPPWHYPFVWTAVTVPVTVWIAVLAGGASVQLRGLWGLCVLNLLAIYAVLMLPQTPLHDGIRLFLPAFPFYALLAGVGLDEVRAWVERALPAQFDGRAPLIGAAAAVLLLGAGVLQTARYHPFQLSYFNSLVGGVEGADRAGLEITFMKEALTPEVLDDLVDRMPADATVDPDLFMEELCFYRELGRIPGGWTLETELEDPRRRGPVTLICRPGSEYGVVGTRREPAPADFVFLLNRKGTLNYTERALWRFGGAPFFELRLQGVPLLKVLRVTGE